MEDGLHAKRSLKYENYGTLEGEVRNSSSVRSQIVANRGQCSTILHNHITSPHSV